MKNQLTGKDPGTQKDRRQEEKGTTEDEMVEWHHRFNGHEFEQAPGDGEGQGSLACFSPWGCKELDMTERLNNKNTPTVAVIFVQGHLTWELWSLGGDIHSCLRAHHYFVSLTCI